MLDKAKNKGESTLYLRNVNVRWFGFDLNSIFEIKASAIEKQKFEIRNGDLLICEGGEPGRAAVWQGGKTEIIFQKAIHRNELPRRKQRGILEQS
jgi:type I restriction enzyme S subunit